MYKLITKKQWVDIKEIPLDTVFDFESIKLKIVINQGCSGCYFERNKKYSCRDMYCTRYARKDNTHIIYKRVMEE